MFIEQQIRILEGLGSKEASLKNLQIKNQTKILQTTFDW